MNILTDSDIVKCSGECYLGFMDIIAHRGLSGIYPENTMLAFRKAIEAGCDGIELDVHLSKDGELVVIHDEKVDRTTDGRGAVKDFTLQELRALDASGKYTGRFGIQPIPTLREYFSYVNRRGQNAFAG